MVPGIAGCYRTAGHDEGGKAMKPSTSRRFLAGAALLASLPAGAICLQPQPVRVCTEFFHSDNVLIGKILSVRKIPNTPDPNNLEGWFYKIQPEKSYRGGALPGNEIYTGNDETSFPMEVGKTYLLFIDKDPQSRPAPNACGNSSEVSKAAESISAIETILKAANSGGGSDIAGRVMLPVAGSQAMSDSGAPGIPLTVKNYVGRDQTVTTDKDGKFDLHVSAGHYSVVGNSDTWDIVPYALSYMKPTEFELADGGCADLVFLAEPK
jgi:hypothetical protein